MHLRTYCRFVFEIEVPTPFVFMLRPRSSRNQWVVSDRYVLKPFVYTFEFTDIYGNLCQRLVAPVGDFSLTTSAEVTVSEITYKKQGDDFVEVQYLPNDILIYLLPSRYCESEYFQNLVTEIAADIPPGYGQVAAIVNWIRANVRYELSGSDAPVSAGEVNSRQWGVCRDLAHLGIALCRALSIPARMVVGYLHGLEPMDMHAWFEAYLGGRWYIFDPTQVHERQGYVVLAYGRDAADVAIYNQFGPVVYPLEKTVSVDCSIPY